MKIFRYVGNISPWGQKLISERIFLGWIHIDVCRYQHIHYLCGEQYIFLQDTSIYGCKIDTAIVGSSIPKQCRRPLKGLKLRQRTTHLVDEKLKKNVNSGFFHRGTGQVPSPNTSHIEDGEKSTIQLISRLLKSSGFQRLVNTPHYEEKNVHPSI